MSYCLGYKHGDSVKHGDGVIDYKHGYKHESRLRKFKGGKLIYEADSEAAKESDRWRGCVYGLVIGFKVITAFQKYL